MSDNKSRDIFYAVVAIATLVVALIGATLAYFSMTASSSEGSVSARAALVSVDYEDGQNLIASGNKLIPVDVEVMQQRYEDNLTEMNNQYSSNKDILEDDTLTPEEKAALLDKDGLCRDGANPDKYQVCSVFRFSVSYPDYDAQANPAPSITATLRSELNEFRDLAYAVRDLNCTPTQAEPLKCWLPLDGTDTYVRLTTCGGDSENPCYTGDTTKTYATIAKYPVFGYDGTSFLTKPITATKVTYDVVLFIKNQSSAQDYDQGKSYSGNVFVEMNNSAQIQGSLN